MFAERILEAAKSAETSGNILTDGKLRCTYRELPEIFEKIDRFLTRSNISAGDCNIIRCGNILADAVLLLLMLYKKRNFLLLPRLRSKLQKEMEDSRLPEFCKNKISVNVDSPVLDIKNPASYIGVETNPGYRSFKDRIAVKRLPLNESGNVFLKTSGSTAEPKLVKHTNTKLFKNALHCVKRFEIGSIDRLLIPVPIYHMYGLGAAFLPGIIAGASINLLGNTNIIKYLDQERQFKPNVSFLTPTLCEMLLKARKSSYHYRLVVTAGDRINQTTFENFEKRFGQLINLYGSTELGAIATSELNAPLDVRSGGIIKPMPHVEIRFAVEDEEKAEHMSEIICKYDYGFEAYVDKKGGKITTETIDWFKTKDLGRRMADNRLKVIGRTGNCINRSGILVAFSEVESIMEQGIEQIRHVVVLAKDKETDRGKKLAACCELKPGAGSGNEEIRSLCFNIMMRHMVPDEVIIMKELPRLPNGKFDRKKLADSLNE